MYPELKDRVAIVTGAGRSGGLGAAMAQRLAAEGAWVVVAELKADAEAQAVVGQIVQAGGKAIALPCDMRDGVAVQALVDGTVQHFGGVDILVNNAGVGYLMKPIVELSLDEWDTVLGVNLRGVFAATQAVARVFAAQHAQGRSNGRIVNIASQAAKSGFPHAAAYCASKHGLVGLARSAAIELGPHGITLNNVCPNHVTTGLGAWQNEYFAKVVGAASVDEYLKAMASRIPMRRPGLPEDTADAVAFLCSDEAKYITAESLNVSGGEEPH